MRQFTLPAGTIKRIHVNRFNIARNVKNGGKLPQWVVQTSKGSISCHRVTTYGTVHGSGPSDTQLSCGARVYLTTTGEITVFIDPRSGWLTKRAKELVNASDS